jgi:hypothetical protein
VSGARVQAPVIRPQRRGSVDLGTVARAPVVAAQRTPVQWAQRIADAFSGVNPLQDLVHRGNCEACSIVTADALVNGTDPVAPGQVIWSASDHRTATATFEEDEDRADEVWEALNRQSAPGTVYVITDEDHAFVVVRDGAGQLYLVDSNQQIYRPANARGDFVTGGNDLLVGEEQMELFFWGALHANWA